VEQGLHPFVLDSKAPTLPLRDFALQEARFAMLHRASPERSEALLDRAQRDVHTRRRVYEQMADIDRGAEGGGTEPSDAAGTEGAP
jgi:pyruvate-ferredoxin/flavodoxin oxidoreductase